MNPMHVKEPLQNAYSRYCLQGVYRQWNSSWERILEDGTYMSDDEFLSNFILGVLTRKIAWRMTLISSYEEHTGKGIAVGKGCWRVIRTIDCSNLKQQS